MRIMLGVTVSNLILSLVNDAPSFVLWAAASAALIAGIGQRLVMSDIRRENNR